MNFFETVYKTLKEHQAKTLIYWSNGTSTGKSLVEKISGIRSLLLRFGTKSTEEILIATPVGENLVSAILAVMAVGAIPVLPPAGSSSFKLVKLIWQRKIRRIVVNRTSFSLQMLAFFSSLKIIEVFNVKEGGPDFSIKTVLPHQSALISHTSGSTGKPKAIYRSHKVLLAQHETLKESFPPFEEQIDFPLFPNILLHNLCTGTVSVLPDIKKFNLQFLDPAKILLQIQQQTPHTITGNVYYFKKLLSYCQLHNIKIEAVEALGIGGSPVPEGLIQELKMYFIKTDIYIIYGSSEAEPIAIRKSEEEIGNYSDGYCVGSPAPGIEISFDITGAINISENETIEPGEIKVRGKHVATTGDWLRTGDWGYMKNNKLFLTARAGNETIKNGTQHYQIEHVLHNLQGVEKAAAIVYQDGFEIYYSGTAHSEIIEKALSENFPKVIFKKISLMKDLPTDNRHYSKILYEKLK